MLLTKFEQFFGNLSHIRLIIRTASELTLAEV